MENMMSDFMKGKRDDRGQLILIGAVLIALAFVSLTLLLNTAIFSENLASRSPDTSGLTPQKISEETSNNVGDTMNQVQYGNLNDAINEIELANRERFSQRGIIYSALLQNSTEGRLISEPARSGSGTVVDAGDNKRLRELTVTLDSGDDATLELTSDTQGVLASAQVVYEIQMTHNGSDVQIDVNESGTASNIGGTSGNLVDPVSGSCTVPADGTETVDITMGKVSQSDCDILTEITYTNDDAEFGSGLGLVDFQDGFSQVEFTNVNGNISWGVVVESSSDVRGFSVSSGNEYTRTYSSIVEITYATDEREYIREIRVSPSEPNYD